MVETVICALLCYRHRGAGQLGDRGHRRLTAEACNAGKHGLVGLSLEQCDAADANGSTAPDDALGINLGLSPSTSV